MSTCEVGETSGTGAISQVKRFHVVLVAPVARALSIEGWNCEKGHAGAFATMDKAEPI